MCTISMFKQYKRMNNIRVYFIQTYEIYFLHSYYYQIVIHEICNGIILFYFLFYF
jgi:hypothetical protein